MVTMTREQYKAKYGVYPASVSESKINTDVALTKMTSAEYKTKYGIEPGQKMPVGGTVSGSETAALPATPLQVSNPLQATKIAPNALKDVWELIKGMTYGTVKNLASIPGEASALVKESGGVGGAVKNLVKALPGATAEVAWGLVPQSAKEIANTQALSEIPKEFQALVKESGGYANALKLIAESIPESIPETVKDYVTQIDRAGQAFINHPLFEALGYVGLKTIAENPAGAIKDTSGALKTTGEFLKSPVKSLTDVGKEVGGEVSKIQNVLKEKETAKIIAAREKEIFDIENNYAKTRKAMDYSKDSNSASRNRIASTDVLTGAVDNTGTVRTKQKGGAIDQYTKQTIDGYEGVVRENLVRENKTVNLEEIYKKLKLEIDKSGLEGADLTTAINGIKKEINGLKLRADVFGDIPLEKIHDAKINTTKNINYQTPPETSTYRKAVARAYKKIVEEKYPTAEKINKELSKYYKDIELLENLDGRKVKGGKLGKYFANITGQIAGITVGGAIGGIPGAAVGSVIGGEVASAIKGKAMGKTFGKETGMEVPKSSILEEAKRNAKLPKSPLSEELKNQEIIKKESLLTEKMLNDEKIFQARNADEFLSFDMNGYSSEMENGYHHFKNAVNKNYRIKDFEDTGKLKEKKIDTTNWWDGGKSLKGEGLSNDEIFDLFKERYKKEKEFAEIAKQKTSEELENQR